MDSSVLGNVCAVFVCGVCLRRFRLCPGLVCVDYFCSGPYLCSVFVFSKKGGRICTNFGQIGQNSENPTCITMFGPILRFSKL